MMKNSKILVVDDMLVNRKIMAKYLRQGGFNGDILFAENGEAGLKQIGEHDPDLVLLDIMMPVMDGYELLQHIKENEKTRMIPVLMVTSLDDRKSKVKALEMGADDFINKPMDASELVARVKSLLRVKEYFKQVEEKNELLEKNIVQLEEANEKLKKLDQVKTDLTSTVSHELRTPITSVIGFAKMIKKRQEDILFPVLYSNDVKVDKTVKQLKNNIDIIISEGERLTLLINDLLDMVKIESTKIQFKEEPLCMNSIIQKALNATNSLLEESNLEIILELASDLPKIKGDEDRLMQVIINLLSNAVKFTDEGSITCRTVHKDDRIIVNVIDQGIGIAAEDIPKVFRKFEQVRSSNTGNRPKGTGLGLPICKEIVEQHGGSIYAESKPGQGSSFFFSIPSFTRSGPDGEARGEKSEVKSQR